MECQNSPGAKHRFGSSTELNARSRLHHTHSSHGFHPGYKLLYRLLRRVLTVPAWTSTDTQCGGDLLGLRRLQKVLKVAVLREDIVERFVHNIVCGCVDESGVLVDLR